MQATRTERVKTWTEKWKQQGLQQGRQEGRQEGEAKVLHRLLSRRFGALPAWVDQRLEQANEVDLEYWTDRVLDAQALDDVFQPQN